MHDEFYIYCIFIFVRTRLTIKKNNKKKKHAWAKSDCLVDGKFSAKSYVTTSEYQSRD